MEASNTNLPQAAMPERHRYLIWGGKGWIAGLLFDMLKAQNKDVHTTTVRMEEREAVLRELDRVRPTHVLNCAGVTGRPNVDWCEDNREATVRSNVIGTLGLADCCYLRGIHCTIFATGCIYTFHSPEHPQTCDPGTGYTESDPANFSGSFYSHTKSLTETLLGTYPHTALILRLRMPVSDDLHPRNFVTKITSYARVVDVPNSNTVLHDLLPVALVLADHHETGVYNFTNAGAISHNEVLGLYRDIVDSSFSWRNFGLEDQAKVIKAGRSNCMLDTSKLEKKMCEYGLEVPEVHEAYRRCFRRMAAGIKRGDMGAKLGYPAAATAGEEKTDGKQVVWGEESKENEVPLATMAG